MAETTKPVEEKIEEETSAVSPEITVDPNHSSLTGIRDDQEADVKAITDGYDTQIAGVGTMVTQQQKAIEDSSQAEIDAQNKYTEDTVNIIEGQKEEARDDYDDETRGAYVDWKQATDPFGVNAEKMAANGLSGSGYSESSKVRMYQAYQSRKALAYKAFTKAMTEYNNQITMARSQNSVTIAQIASNAIKEKARIALEGFYYKNDLITKKTDAITETNRYYDSLWLDQYDRLYEQEKDERDFLQRQEEERQAQANWQAEFDQDQANWQAKFDADQAQAAQDQANWEALYGEDGLYRQEEEEEDVVIKKDDETEPPVFSGYEGVDGGNINSKGQHQNSAAETGNLKPVPTQLPNKLLTSSDGNPLTFEQIGADNIHVVDTSSIEKALPGINADQLDELRKMGVVEERFYEDKDGKIMMTFIIKDQAAAERYLYKG